MDCLEVAPAGDDDGFHRLEAALRAHGLPPGTQIPINRADDPLPGPLLSQARLRSMSPPELFLHEPSAQDVPFVGVHNEWLALRACQTQLAVLPRGLTLDRVEQALEALCAAAPEGEGTAADDRLLRGLAADFGCDASAVCVADCCWGARGLVARRALARGETALAVAPTAMLSVAAARESELAAVLPLVDEGEWTEHAVVMLLLLHERRRGRQSRWWRFLRALPRSFGNVNSWGAAELREGLARSGLYWRALSSREEMFEVHATLLPRLRAAAPDLFPRQAYSREAWVWARAVVETRGIALPGVLPHAAGSLAAGSLVVVPIVDLCNHSEAPLLSLVACGGRLCARAVVPVEAGVQLTISYGSLDATELLLHHGILHPRRRVRAGGEGGGEGDDEADREDGRLRLVAAARSPPPLRVAVDLQPCDALGAQDDLLSSVLLLMGHIGLALEGWVGEGPCEGRATERTPRPAPEGRTRRRAVPLRLLAAARMLSITEAEQLSTLPISCVDAEAPLSADNEAAAVLLLTAALEAALHALGDEAATNGGGDESEAASAAGTGRKRRRGEHGGKARGSVEPVDAGGRTASGRQLRAQQRSLLRAALDEVAKM